MWFYCDDNVNYYVSNYATLESETSDGETHPLPDILKLYLQYYQHGKDTIKGTLLTEDAIKHLNDEDTDTLNNEVDEDYGSCPMCSSSYSCTCASICHNGNVDVGLAVLFLGTTTAIHFKGTKATAILLSNATADLFLCLHFAI